MAEIRPTRRVNNDPLLLNYSNNMCCKGFFFGGGGTVWHCSTSSKSRNPVCIQILLKCVCIQILLNSSVKLVNLVFCCMDFQRKQCCILGFKIVDNISENFLLFYFCSSTLMKISIFFFLIFFSSSIPPPLSSSSPHPSPPPYSHPIPLLLLLLLFLFTSRFIAFNRRSFSVDVFHQVLYQDLTFTEYFQWQKMHAPEGIRFYTESHTDDIAEIFTSYLAKSLISSIYFFFTFYP